jgi:hypothetical protein
MPKHVFVERRILTAILSLSFFLNMLDSAYLLAFAPGSRTALAARFTEFPWVIVALFILGALSTVPLIISALLGLPNRGYVRLACLGLCAASFNWVGLAYLTRHITVEGMLCQHLQNGMLALLYAGALAATLNNQIKVLLQREMGVV